MKTPNLNQPLTKKEVGKVSQNIRVNVEITVFLISEALTLALLLGFCQMATVREVMLIAVLILNGFAFLSLCTKIQ